MTRTIRTVCTAGLHKRDWPTVDRFTEAELWKIAEQTYRIMKRLGASERQAEQIRNAARRLKESSDAASPL